MKDLSKLSEAEKAITLARREYMRKWRAKNPTKQKEYNDRFFSKQAQNEQQGT